MSMGDSAEEVLRPRVSTEEAARQKEERLAWDRYAAGATVAGAINGMTPSLAGKWADQLLEERRKRFGSSVK
jgi:hypothetical protein